MTVTTEPTARTGQALHDRLLGEALDLLEATRARLQE